MITSINEAEAACDAAQEKTAIQKANAHDARKEFRKVLTDIQEHDVF